jgi:hypothetical protein
LFPSIENAASNVTHKGKVFNFRLERLGIMISKRVTEVDSKQWDECTQCPEFNNCYLLSMAKLGLEQAVRTYA